MRLTRRAALAAFGSASFLAHTREVRAQSAPHLDARLSALRLASGTPGVALAWQRAGQSVRVVADGLRSASEGITPVAPLDRWHLGSLTKSMTATLAAVLVESGRIDWATSVGDALPKAKQTPYGQMTLLHLLSHRAGLPHDLPNALMDRFPRAPVTDPIADRLSFTLSVLSLAPAYQPGQYFHYSNAGYVVAATMMEAQMGLPWEQLIKDMVFSPLGLGSAGFGPPALLQQTIDAPFGHQITGAGLRTAVTLDNPVAMSPAGRVHMDLADLVRYLVAHRDREPRLLARRSWRMLHRVHFGGDYALGWVVLPNNDLWHNGSNGLWYAEALISPRAVAAFAANDAAAQSGQPSDLIKAALTG